MVDTIRLFHHAAGRSGRTLTERRLSALVWAYTQRGLTLDRRDRHIATVLAGIRNSHAAPPRQKEAILPEDLLAMLETCDRGTLRGLRDRAMLLMTSPAVCAAPRSPGWMSAATSPRTGGAG